MVSEESLVALFDKLDELRKLYWVKCKKGKHKYFEGHYNAYAHAGKLLNDVIADATNKDREISESYDLGMAEGITLVRGNLLKLQEALESLDEKAANSYRSGKGSYFEGQSDAYEHAVRLVEEVIYIFSDDE